MEVLCTDCGYWRPNLVARTGMCAYCTAQDEDKVVLLCVECGLEKPVRRHEIRPKCTNCRSRWYRQNDEGYRLAHNRITARWHQRKRAQKFTPP